MIKMENNETFLICSAPPLMNVDGKETFLFNAVFGFRAFVIHCFGFCPFPKQRKGKDFVREYLFHRGKVILKK
jgi:hypothetical protein